MNTYIEDTAKSLMEDFEIVADVELTEHLRTAVMTNKKTHDSCYFFIHTSIQEMSMLGSHGIVVFRMHGGRSLKQHAEMSIENLFYSIKAFGDNSLVLNEELMNSEGFVLFEDKDREDFLDIAEMYHHPQDANEHIRNYISADHPDVIEYSDAIQFSYWAVKKFLELISEKTINVDESF